MVKFYQVESFDFPNEVKSKEEAWAKFLDMKERSGQHQFTDVDECGVFMCHELKKVLILRIRQD